MHYVCILISLVLVGIDRFTKWLVVENMEPSQSINLIKAGDKEVLNLYYTLNDGAAFSKLSGKTIFLIVITSIVIVVLLALLIMKRVHRPVYLAAISLILGGGIGNLIDRIFNHGEVVDFIDFRIINFPVFNFADICACCGAGLLVLVVIMDEVRSFRKKRAEGDGKEGTELPKVSAIYSDGENDEAPESAEVSDELTDGQTENEQDNL